jgi:hypothetical protein
LFEAEEDRLMNRVSESALILHFAASPQTPWQRTTCECEARGGKPNVNQEPAAMLTDRAKNLDFAEKSAGQAKSWPRCRGFDELGTVPP